MHLKYQPSILDFERVTSFLAKSRNPQQGKYQILKSLNSGQKFECTNILVPKKIWFKKKVKSKNIRFKKIKILEKKDVGSKTLLVPKTPAQKN